MGKGGLECFMYRPSMTVQLYLPRSQGCESESDLKSMTPAFPLFKLDWSFELRLVIVV